MKKSCLVFQESDLLTGVFQMIGSIDLQFFHQFGNKMNAVVTSGSSVELSNGAKKGRFFQPALLTPRSISNPRNCCVWCSIARARKGDAADAALRPLLLSDLLLMALTHNIMVIA